MAPAMPMERERGKNESVCLGGNHRQTFLRSCVRQGQEHQEIGYGAIGTTITLFDPDPTALVADRNEGITGFFATASPDYS